MKSSNIKLNIILSIIIVFLVIYFTFLNYVNEKNTIKEGNIGRKIRNSVKSAVKPVENKLMSQMDAIEKKMQGQVKVAIDKSTKPITSVLKIITSQLNAVTKVVTNAIKGIKSGVVTPLVNVFKYIGLMFSQLGLLIFDFLLQIAQIPNCLISYIIWIIMTLKEQVIMAIIFPIIQKILKKIFGRFYPATIVGYFIKFLNWFVNFYFYILSLIGSFFGITDLFYKEKCFNFTGNFKKRIDNMKKHLIDAGNSFTQFGKFDF
jgi:hypothetical protein